MKEENQIPENDKLNSSSIGDDPESLRKLEASIIGEIDGLNLSEFDEEEEEWSLFRKKTVKKESDEKSPDAVSAKKREKEYDPDLDDAEYIQSEAYKRKTRRTLTYEQREARRKRRITEFWDFVDRNTKQIFWVILAVLVIAAAIAAGVVSSRWTYRSLKELLVSEKEDTISVSYANINGKVLKYGVDGAVLVDHNNDLQWTISYDMSDPEVVICQETFAIYDSKGTSIRVCDSTGEIGTISADMPIIKANVSAQGLVAAILEDGQNAWIKSYARDGSEIAALKGTFTNPGYPMDLAFSEDGTLMAVSYLYLDQGTPVSKVYFYNFGTVGQNQVDNLVSETEYSDIILPELEYIDTETCVAFREDGFSVFTGKQIPSETVKVDTADNIVSTFFDSEYIGLVFQNYNSEYDYTICVYNKKGKEILNMGTDFRYRTIQMNDEQIVLFSGDEICIYNLQGVEKYRGSLDASTRAFIGFGRNKFVYVTEDLFKIVQLN